MRLLKRSFLNHGLLNLDLSSWVRSDLLLEFDKQMFNLSYLLLDILSSSFHISNYRIFGLLESISSSLDVGEDSGVLLPNVSLDGLAEAAPLVLSTVRSVGRKDDAVEVLPENSRVLVNDADLAVQVASLLILDDDSGVHNVLVRLRNERNQEVNDNDEDQELIGKPEQVDGVHGNVGSGSNSSILALLVVVPVGGGWWVDVSDGVLPCLDHDLGVDVNVWVSS